jgi:hypothetical protein
MRLSDPTARDSIRGCNRMNSTHSVRDPGTSGHDIPCGLCSAIKIAVLIPCYNEEPTIRTVIEDFRAVLPLAAVYVYDNNSSDRSVEQAKDTEAIVRHEPQQGKGNVVRRMFADVEADVYVMVDGDSTYDAMSAPLMVQTLLAGNLDLINAVRVTDDKEAYRRGHRLGNRVISLVVGAIFGARLSDMLSGYKVLSRRFVKSFPALAAGFEIETELAVHALQLRMPLTELPTRYQQRVEGSSSKLRTVPDGLKVLWTIFLLVKEERPLAFFSTTCAALIALSLGLAAPVIVTFVQTGLVGRLPTAVLAMGIMMLAFLSLTCGLVLDTVTRARVEMKRLHYLSFPAPGTLVDPAETMMSFASESSSKTGSQAGTCSLNDP